jgi:hypothetical protein
VPAVFGAVVGAAINHYAAKRRGEQDREWALEMLGRQERYASCRSGLEATRELREAILGGATKPYGGLHDRWARDVHAHVEMLDNAELVDRSLAFGTVVRHAAVTDSTEYVNNAMLQGALDLEHSLRAWLLREPLQPRRLPRNAELQSMFLVRNRVTFDKLNDWLQSRA